MCVVRMFKGLFRSIAAVYLDNRRFIKLAGVTRDYYVHGGTLPEGAEKLSVALRCEENGAHRILEEVMTQVKRFPRGEIPKEAVRYRLWGSSVRLLDSLRSTAELLPSELSAAADKLIEAILHTRNLEHAICNFMLGLSGADEHIGATDYSVRLDKFLRDLKANFNDIAVGFDRVERALVRCKTVRRMLRRKVGKPRREVSEASRIKVRDLADIRKEVKRRVRDKMNRGVSTTLKAELKCLYRDEAWSRRCHQWSFDTLYSYIIRRHMFSVCCCN